MVNLSQEIAINIIKELVKILPYLSVEIQEQVKLRNKIEEQLNDYEITSRCTELSRCDILDKAYIYLSCKKLEGMSDSTIYGYTLLFKKMNEYFNKPLSTINTIDLRLFIGKVYKDNQPSSKNNKVSKLKAFFSWLQNEGYITQNPTSNLHEVKVPIRSRGHIQSVDLEKIRENCVSLRDKLLIEILISTGCRVSEISNMLIDKINWSENSINIIGKGNKERKVYFSSRARLFMMKYIKQREEDGIFRDYLFVTCKKPHDKLGSRSIQKDVKRIAITADITYNVFPHLYRRTLSTIAVEQGVKVTSLQKILGHSNIGTTQRYYDLNDNNVKHEYRKIAM